MEKVLDIKKIFKHIAGQQISQCLCMLTVWGNPQATGTVWGVKTVYKPVQRKSTKHRMHFLNLKTFTWIIIVWVTY